MMNQEFNLAAIDVGSNAVRLLIKTVFIDNYGKISMRKVLFLRIALRLGMEVFDKGKIEADKKEELTLTMQAFAQIMKVFRVRNYRACATSAMRDAQNSKEILEEILKSSSIKLQIITGDEEAKLIYDSHLVTMIDKNDYLYVDVGGGSTEITLISNAKLIISHSFNVGTIRILRKKVTDSEIKNLQSTLEKISMRHKNLTIIGSGGNINKLARISNGKKDEQIRQLSVETLRNLYQKLRQMSLEERMNKYNMKSDRADVIVPAAEIFLFIANQTGSKRIIVPNLGLADGIINDLAQQYL